MATFRSGGDAHVREDRPKQNFGQVPYPLMRAGADDESLILLVFPKLQAAVRRKTTPSSTLTVPVHGTWPAGTKVTVAPVRGDWAAGRVTYAKKPGLRESAPTASVTTGSTLNDGDLLVVDVTAVVSAVSAGASDLGWLISTTSTADRRVKGFSAPGADDGWQLQVDILEPGDPLVNLVPAGGAIGTGFWVAEGEAAEGDDDESTLVALRVQVDAALDETSPDFDTGWRAVTEPRLPLAGTGYPGLAAMATTSWRVNGRDEGGRETGWSDWVDPITHVPWATATWSSPNGSEITDGSPVLEAVTSVPVAHYQWLVTAGGDRSKIRWTSGKQKGPGGTVVSDQVPYKAAVSARGKPRIVFDDNAGSYQIGFRWWDRTDRVGSEGDRTYREMWKTVTFRPAANPAPQWCTATEVGVTPKVRVEWGRQAAADEWVIIRDGVRIDVVDHDDVRGSTAGAWAWIDKTASAWTEHRYAVKARERTTVRGEAGESKASPPSEPVVTRVEGTWFLRDNGDTVVLESNEGLTQLELNHRRATYSPPALTYNVHVRTAPSFLAGPITGQVSDVDDTGQDMWEAIGILLELANPAPGKAGETVQVVSGTSSFPIRFDEGPKVLAAATFHEGDQAHDVWCTVQQVDEYDEL